MGDFSASGAARARECPASAALPRVQETSDDADRGTEIHEYSKRRLQGWTHERALVLLPTELHDMCSRIDFDRVLIGREDVRAEVAYGLDTAEDRAWEVGVDIGRRYPPAPPHVVHGTIDIVSHCTFDDVPCVDDWKTGFQGVARCEDNDQMLYAARAVHLVTGAPRVKARILYVRPSGVVFPDEHTFSLFELDDYAGTLADTVARVQRAKALVASGIVPDVHAGSWCKYCPSLDACPRHVALARAMLPELANLEERMAALTPEQGGAAWLKMKACASVLDRVEKGLKKMAAVAPLPVGNGKEVRPLTIAKSFFSKERAIELLRQRGATTEEIATCTGTREETQFRIVNERS